MSVFQGNTPRQFPLGVTTRDGMRITCNSHCLSKILAVSPFSDACDLAEAYRWLSKTTFVAQLNACEVLVLQRP